jgi:biopolymer transport protein ExbB
MLTSLLVQLALLGQVTADPVATPDAPAAAAPAPDATITADPVAPPATSAHDTGMLTGILLKLTMVGAEWVLWLLVLLSIVSVALIVERCLYFYNHRVDGEQLGQQVEQLLGEGNVRAVWDLVNGSDCIEHEVVAAGLPALRRGATACSEAMMSAKARLKPVLDSRLSMLATIGANAPFVGLLGTVLGIVKAANDLAGGGAGQGDPNAVMAGVFEALVATAVGLFVAIPAVVAFNLLQLRVKTTLSQVDALAHLVLANVRVESKKGVGSMASESAPPVVARTN